MITWIEKSDVKLKFLGIIEIFEVCGSLIYCSCEAGWQKLHLFQISINFKSRCILCDAYSTHVFTIMHVDIFHGSKGDFPVTCVVTSFKIQNHYIVANLTVAVYLAEDCCTSSMKLWVPRKVVLFIVLPSHYMNAFYIEHSFW